MQTNLRPLPIRSASAASPLQAKLTDYVPFASLAKKAPTKLVGVVGAQPRLDSSLRIGLGKAAEALDWDAETSLFAKNDGNVLVITRSEPGQASNIRLGQQARLGLNPGALRTLGAKSGSQVQVIADVENERMVLVSLHTVLSTVLSSAGAEVRTEAVA